MAKRIVFLCDWSILFCYFALAVITPLIFSTQNSELFEVPKMLFVYFMAATVLLATKIKFIILAKNSLPVNITLISFSVFLLTQIVSALFSIDKFTSFYGFPSRLNGGILSQFAYLIIFGGALINLNAYKAKRILMAAVLSAFIVALWGIPAHFGKDPNCLILTGSLNSACWQKDFDPTIRIFSTLGQPNWLASYLILVLPLSMALMTTFKKPRLKLIFFAISLTLLLTFIFTNSRAGALGLAVSALTFCFLLGLNKIKKESKWLFSAALIFIIFFVLFGTRLTSRISEAVKQPAVQSENNSQTSATDQIAQKGPTESGQIRLIVWKGALEIIKNNPLLGTGPETFAYSYYQYRPLMHNQTTEWNFFYNKAHNEILNIASNTGIIGIISFLLFISATVYTLYKGSQNSPENTSLLAKSSISAILGYQTSIFFGFSTVTSQVILFLLISASLILCGQNKIKEINLNFLKKPLRIASAAIATVISLYFMTFILRLYLADIFIARAKNLSSQSAESLIIFSNALTTDPTENPFYLADAANSMALYAQNSSDIETSKSFETQADLLAQRSKKVSNANVLTARKIANTYILLASINPIYKSKAQEIGDLIVRLAPTDPQSYNSLAKVQIAIGLQDEAEKSLVKALELKPDYKEAKDLLEQLKTTNYNEAEK